MDEGPYLLIISARFYPDVADELQRGAFAAIEAAGGTHMDVEVPGTLEIPAALRMAVRSMELVGGRRRFDAYVALGCVIRGETDHYDHVCREAIHGISDLTTQYSLAVGMGILTCETMEQAIVRAAADGTNRGGNAAEAALAMMEVKRGFLPAR
ncbi:MAG TPA: 6,7-dimethyl-8-ribityllumazine synthase [Alphaproteobacteria bacterium]|jgi:6,7-dimethyl-8-ribityllumazine synthase|nr:6,7-dimethyl-8-ribityllumazine synthase [Alphaproteobacteria bacterium]